MHIQRKDNQVFIQMEAYRHEHLVLRFLTLALVSGVIAYGYFVGFSIMNVIAHKEAAAKSAQLKSSLSRLEQTYFELTKNMSPDMGSAIGLGPTEHTEYIRRAGTVGVASRANEI